MGATPQRQSKTGGVKTSAFVVVALRLIGENGESRVASYASIPPSHLRYRWSVGWSAAAFRVQGRAGVCLRDDKPPTGSSTGLAVGAFGALFPRTF